jgi:hypothetical protein
MNGVAARVVRFSAGFLILLAMGWILTSYAASPNSQGLPTDWSHRHVIFTLPATDAQFSRVSEDPRFWQQWARRNAMIAPRRPQVRGDWAQSLGAGASSGAGNYPAKYSFHTSSASCGNVANPDFVVFSTGLTGSGTQASIVAFDNLYSGCTVGTVPSAYWAYNTGGQILTSPVLSQDGTQIAFVETNGTNGTLVLLKWAASTGTVGAPASPTVVPGSTYSTCAAPCMTEINLKNGSGANVNDTTSSVFYDYGHDIAWVGGANGWLHKITPVFKSSSSTPPLEVTTGGFPAQVNKTTPTSLSSPVYDYATSQVFVGDYGGYLYRVSSAGVVTQSGLVDHGTGLVAAPIVDSTNGLIYAFSSNNGTANCSGTEPCTGVYQFTPTFAAGNLGLKVAVGGSSAAPEPLYEGAFDNAYLTSANGTGNLYVCGNTGGHPVMYRVTITAGVMGAVVAGPGLTPAADTVACSPVTDISNPSATGEIAEWFFASVQNNGVGSLCSGGGCLMNFGSQAWVASHAYTIGQQILDSNFQIQVVRVAGTSGTAAPTWNKTVGANTTDAGTLRWTNQGVISATYASWAASHLYNTRHAEIVDSNFNIQEVATTGTSKAGTHPAWSTTVTGATPDGTVTWHMVGALATNSYPAAGGTGGIIIDNIAGSGIIIGGSQVYFSTLGNQTTCGATTNVGCAVQATQSQLQ